MLQLSRTNVFCSSGGGGPRSFVAVKSKTWPCGAVEEDSSPM